MAHRSRRHLTVGGVSLFVVVVASGLASCGLGNSSTGDPTVGPSSPGNSRLPERDTALIVKYDDTKAMKTWTLTCGPSGGSHPDPELACRVLIKNGAEALPAVARDRVCAQVAGSAQSATITGIWRGQKISSRLNLQNSCEISRWKAMAGLLPPATL